MVFKTSSMQAAMRSNPFWSTNRPMTPIHCYRSELASRSDAVWAGILGTSNRTVAATATNPPPVAAGSNAPEFPDQRQTNRLPDIQFFHRRRKLHFHVGDDSGRPEC